MLGNSAKYIALTNGIFFWDRYRVVELENQLSKAFKSHEQYLSWLSINMVISFHSTLMSSVFHYMWEAAGCLVVHLDLLHWDLITVIVLAFPEMLTSLPRKKKGGDTHRSHMSLLSSQCRIHRSRPHRSRCCISRGHKRTLQGEMGGKPLSLGRVAVCAVRGRKCFGLCLLASSYRINLNSKYAYLSSVPKGTEMVF